MELAALLLAVISGAVGLSLRRSVCTRTGWNLLGAGLAAMACGVGAFFVAWAGWITAWTAAGLAFLLFLPGIVLTPLGLALLVGRRP